MDTTKKNKSEFLSIKIEPEVKNLLGDMAVRKCMDMSKLARAILTNWVKPGTYSL